MDGVSMYTISYPFLDWVVTACIEASEGMLTEENTFDERNLGMVDLVQQSLSKGLGYACMISKASIDPVDGRTPDDTVLRVVVHVAVARNAALCDTDTTPLAEHLFTRFSAGCMNPIPGIGCPDVGARKFKATVTKGATLDEFEVYYDLTINN